MQNYEKYKIDKQGNVWLIRENVGTISNVKLGLMFGVSRSTISKIKTGINWRNN